MRIERELEQAQMRLEALIRKGASDYEIMQARKNVQRLAKKAKKRVDKSNDDW